ncbi:Gfo/Idh/MocA family protein [Thermotoga sp. KOL6]|uniref:Gfo/Idh/MocA family protein n=1 Tax=Thermotoga sp. KOL6 TaxID=126741 RepID=UPI000CB2A4CE|nr:Gfo/Idh/MocA family oxidoreductase [Thermotoga sp. KOL6]PLV58285.1 hypothetical protein AS005_07900 [Thermotoga sp. KOL6]
MKKLKMGVIGAGKISEVLHIPNIYFSEYAELVSIADPNEERLRYFRTKYFNLKTYKNYEEMLKNEDVEAVVVAVPNSLHAEISLKALKSGKHVLVEKPMATSSKEAMKMIDTAKDHKKVLMVNHSQRFFPHHQKAKEIIEAGLIGEVRVVKTMFSHSGPENWSPNASWFFQKEKAFFGVLGDLGVHKIDLIRYLTNLDFTKCFAQMARLEKAGNVEDTASAILELSNGGIATLDVNWITKGLEENYIVVYGDKGTLKVGQTDPTKIDIYISKPVSFHGEIKLKPLFTNEDPYWKLPVIDHFAKVCLGMEEPIVKPEDGYIAIKVIERLIESSEKGRLVHIEE